jgi:V/A-type H+-transporting ATPase subunit I
MIVPMKKATVIVKQADQPKALLSLRKLGTLHLNALPANVPEAQKWREKKQILDKALSLLPPASENEISSPAEYNFDRAVNLAQEIIERDVSLKILSEDFEQLNRESLYLQEWDSVCESDLKSIIDQGYQIKFYEISPQQLPLFKDAYKVFAFNRSKSKLKIVLIHPNSAPLEYDFKEIIPPRRNLETLQILMRENINKRESLAAANLASSVHTNHIIRAIREADGQTELSEATAAMVQTGPVSYITGFVPEEQVVPLKNIGRENHWGLLFQTPTAEDDVPSIIKNNRWVRIIQPVFDLLGTVPGYRENDISIFFLLFFTFFFAAIIGDAGYGLVLFSFSLFLTLRLNAKKKSAPPALTLMMLLSSATILWGALTGNWFGSVNLSKLPFLSWMTIPALSSFNPKSGETFKYIFFVVGTLHISIAHIWNFIKQLKEKPLIRAFTQLGWLFLVLGLYYLVLYLVLSKEQYPLPKHAMWLMITGLAFIIIFSCQEGNFFRGVGKGVANLLTTFLSSISAFSDIISYIRLFAVGLAGIEIAKSFNAMAAGFGSGVTGLIVASIILLLGHTLNIAMGALSVVVHGVRLNMLEFSGHLGMEWTGKPYKPFKE